MYCCHSILECYNLFSGVKLSIRSFCFICMGLCKFCARVSVFVLLCCFGAIPGGINYVHM